jgi:hypothetical protein
MEGLVLLAGASIKVKLLKQITGVDSAGYFYCIARIERSVGLRKAKTEKNGIKTSYLIALILYA